MHLVLSKKSKGNWIGAEAAEAAAGAGAAAASVPVLTALPTAASPEWADELKELEEPCSRRSSILLCRRPETMQSPVSSSSNTYACVLL